jgi:glutamate formiminotransferase/formiminotetrahydrofolate cyclodeaminase
MLEAGRYFLEKQQRSTGVSEKELIRIAILSMGLDDLGPFVPEERIIEYLLRSPSADRLVKMPLLDFADETASESSAPGGGSIAAYTAALGAALATMVANLSAHKKGWDNRWKEFSDWAEKGQTFKDELIRLVDADTRAFDSIMIAFSLPKGNESEKALRQQAIQEATRTAIEVPFRVMEVAFASLEVTKAMALAGNPNSVSDAGVGALCARAGVLGAFMNVRINAAGYEDKGYVTEILAKGKQIADKTVLAEAEILRIVQEKIGI